MNRLEHFRLPVLCHESFSDVPVTALRPRPGFAACWSWPTKIQTFTDQGHDAQQIESSHASVVVPALAWPALFWLFNATGRAEQIKDRNTFVRIKGYDCLGGVVYPSQRFFASLGHLSTPFMQDLPSPPPLHPVPPPPPPPPPLPPPP